MNFLKKKLNNNEEKNRLLFERISFFAIILKVLMIYMKTLDKDLYSVIFFTLFRYCI